jgi:tripartite ATP-independent transporter DctP family solute receptor
MFAIRTIIALAALAGTAGSAAHGKTLRSSDVYPADYPTVQAAAHMDKLVRERTGGRHGIERLGQNDQDSENYTVAEVQNGMIDMARVNLAVFDRLVALAVIPSLPYLFRSTPHMRRVLDGPVGDEILADLEGHGIIGLCFYDMGARSYGANRPIRNVGDMKGLKVRVQQSDIWATLLRTMAAEPATMPLVRTWGALRAGAIDAAEGTLPAYVASRHHEVARFYSLTEHSMAPGVLIISRRVWDKFTPDDQRIIRAAARESVTYLRRVWDEREVLARLTAEAAGVEIVIDVDQKSFADILTPHYPALLPSPRQRDVVKRIQATE